ncbi:MAG: hypothetical protein A2189_08780, partial [Paenibacillus sp. RIFOXYA1_FULL_44_5]
MGICIITTYPPRRCGLAEFSSYLRQGLLNAGETDVPIVALVNESGLNYSPEVIHHIRYGNLHDYDAAVPIINHSADIDAVILQHEFSLFGGQDDDYLFNLLARLTKPVLTVFHTIPDSFPSRESEIIKNISHVSKRVICLSERGKQFLHAVCNVEPQRIAVIPNGIPDIGPRSQEQLKEGIHAKNRIIAMTGGLLNPNKGIELVLYAMPRVVRKHPEFLYLIIGATLPHELQSNGESYRNKLHALSVQLGIADHVRFNGNYMSNEEFIDHLIASDIFITPYRGRNQNSSATLAYAAYYGKACISTPYYYAEELLGGVGLLFPFNDHRSLAYQLNYLLDTPGVIRAFGDAAKQKTKHHAWPEVAR